jgi:hypothetical protein
MFVDKDSFIKIFVKEKGNPMEMYSNRQMFLLYQLSSRRVVRTHYIRHKLLPTYLDFMFFLLRTLWAQKSKFPMTKILLADKLSTLSNIGT